MKRNLQEKCRMVTGNGAWHIGTMHVSDGPHGVRAQKDGAKNDDSYEATCFPTASSVACSWNVELIEKMSEGIAREAKELGVSVMLGPGVNMKRSPLCGRNFEYYSEDPLLAGELAAHYISAMQRCGVGTSLKHYAGNNQETHRMTANSMIDERTLHEIYLTAFEIAVKKAKPASVMASYNYVNGMPACENSYLLKEILREKWGYRGLVMSDWGACVDLPACIDAGMDVEMPDSMGNHMPELEKAVKSGKLPIEKLDQAVERIEKLMAEYGKKRITENQKKEVSKDTRRKNHVLAGWIEAESAVLLKNESFFPLRTGAELLIIGDLAEHPRYQGGGSSHIHTEMAESVTKQLEKYYAKVRYVKGYKRNTFNRNKRLEQEALRAVKQAVRKGIPILFFGGLTDMAEGEGYDREHYDLPYNQTALLRQILKITDRVGFISFGGAPYDMEFPARCKALLQMYLGGESVGKTCADIMMGRVNPSGKLAESIPFSEKDVPSYGYFGKQGRQKKALDDVEYRESIFVGYRYYDTFDIPVRYCFGHGLSYTTYKYSNLRVKKNGQTSYEVSFEVQNAGSMAGSEIAEVYVKNPNSDAFRAKRELRGFAKVRLEPGECKTVTIPLAERAFSVYQNHEFQVIGGEYEIQIGASLQDIRLSQKVEIEGSEVKCPLTLNNKVPLSRADFDKLYEGKRTHFSQTMPGEFTTKNSLNQMRPYSHLARRWLRIGKLAVRLMYFPKPMHDPEVRMMWEGIADGNIDSVCNQSGGLVKHKTILKIVKAANEEEKV